MIFVDTGFWLALWSERDPDHARVVETFAPYEGQRLSDLLLTSNHVAFETLTLAQARAGHQLAVAAGKKLYSEKRRLRVLDGPAQAVQAEGVEEIAGPQVCVTWAEAAALALHHEAIEPPPRVGVDLDEFLGRVPDAEVVAPAAEHGCDWQAPSSRRGGP